jgi:Right handed beta helix region
MAETDPIPREERGGDTELAAAPRFGRRAARLRSRRARFRRGTIAVSLALLVLVPIAAGATPLPSIASLPWWPSSPAKHAAPPDELEAIGADLAERSANAGARGAATGSGVVGKAPARCDLTVSPSGSDTSAGTAAKPFRTISHAEAAAEPGDVVCVRAGTYGERVTLIRSGAADKRITVTAYPRETPVIDGTGVLLGPLDALFQIAGGTNFVSIRGLTIQNSGGRGVENGGSHNEVLDTTITRTRSAGLLTTNKTAAATDNLYSGNDISDTVQGNDCHRPSDPCRVTGGWESAINHFTEGGNPYGHDTYVANNVHDNGGEGITVADDDTVVGNQLHDNFSVDVYLDGTRRATIDKNFIYETEQAKPSGGPSAYRLQAIGIALADEQSPATTSDNNIRNNVIVNTSIGLNFWQATPSSALIDETIDNNTIVNTWTCGICFDSAPHVKTSLRNNLVVPRTGQLTSGTEHGGISALGNVFAMPASSNDPHLNGEGTFSVDLNDFLLQPVSVSAIDKGVATTANDDIVGTRRPQGSHVDVGASELVARQGS